MVVVGAQAPGRLGPPLLGETLSLLQNPFRFLEDRQQRYGPVFKSRILGRNTVFLSGLSGAEAFYNRENVVRSDAHPFTLVELFGGVNMEMYDGPKHAALKSMAIGAFDLAAIAGYVPDMQQGIEQELAELARRDEFSATVELRRLSIATICGNLMGIAPGPLTDDITRDYGIVLNGLIALPIPLPMLAYGRARAARDRLLQRIRELIKERRGRPGPDALSRLLAARSTDGRVYTDEEALLEVHHVVIAGFIVYAIMAEGMRRLAEEPELLDRCLAEVREQVKSRELELEALQRLPTLTNVVLEAKRYVPLVPLAFGRANRSFVVEGRVVPEGWRVYLALWLNNRDPSVFSHPDVFEPDRFDIHRAEHLRHPMSFIPQGAAPMTGHQCLGLDYSTYLTLTFLTLLLRDYEWSLPPQDLSTNWRKLPPEPRDALRVRLRPKSS